MEKKTPEYKLACNARHMDTLDKILIRPHRAEGQQIRQAAADAGQSLQAWLLQAARERIARDAGQQPTPHAIDD